MYDTQTYLLFRLCSKTPVYSTMRSADDLTLKAVYCKMRDEAAKAVNIGEKNLQA